MQHIRFGRTGLQVFRLCLGTMTFGFQCDETTSHAILNAAAAQGITFLDTADVYRSAARRRRRAAPRRLSAGGSAGSGTVTRRTE